MNRGKGLLLTILALALPAAAGAGASDCRSLSVARWMLGDWVTGDWKSVTHESWTERGPQTFEGAGSERSITDGKTMNSEALRLVEMAGGVYYVAKVEHNPLPVAFALTECGADRLVFENPAHDFPRRLEYSHPADGGLVVAVSDGRTPGSRLVFEREVAGPDPGASVLAAEDARFSAMIGANGPDLAACLADDLQYVHANGQVANRRQFVDSIASGEFRYQRITPGERRVTLLGDRAALVVGRGQFLVVHGDRLDLDLRYLAAYELDGDGRWRLLAWQSLRLPQKTG